MTTSTLVKPLIILSENYRLEDLLNNNEILLACAGAFSDEECDKHLQTAEAEVLSVMEEKKLRKRIFYIIVESIQNISRHKADTRIEADGSTPLLLIGKHRDYHYVLTANPIENEKIQVLKDRIDLINLTGGGKLRELYKETLNEGDFNLAGGANLGLIDIARKAGGQLQYGFDRIDAHHSYFILKINIDGVG